MESRTVGTIVLDTIRPNVIHLRCLGELHVLEVNALDEYTKALRLEIGDLPIFAYVVVCEGFKIDKLARRAIVGFARDRPWVATAVCGARYEVRVLLELTMNAIQLLVKDSGEVKFMDDMGHALAWLEQLGALPPAEVGA